jgi:glucosyl-3-phosphoglycerate synthase
VSLSFVQSDYSIDDLLAAKAGATVSVCLPARNEETTVRAIVRSIERELVVPGLVDETVVVDDGSVDTTASAAASAGARVVPSVGGPGKGQAMRTGLSATTGSVLVFCDADLYEFDAGFIVGLLGPLLTRPEVQFVKGFYRRPFGDRPDEGGRVTELVARPLLELLCPHLAHIVQPLGGESAGRRSASRTSPRSTWACACTATGPCTNSSRRPRR